MAAEAPSPIVEVRDLQKRYGDSAVLRGVSLQARAGEVVTLIGASGSGKSTLLRCLNLLEVPDAGEIRIEGETLRLTRDRSGQPVPADARQVERVRRRLGMVFQQFNLWPHRNVLDNVTEVPIHVLGVPRTQARAEAEVLLQQVGMADKRDVYPAFLSGGQQQRVAIARALATRPAVLLLDEPTSALDPELVGEVLKVIHDLAARGTTMLLVTHEMAFAREVSTQVVFLHQGLVEECGTPAQIFDAPLSERCRQFVGAPPSSHPSPLKQESP